MASPQLPDKFRQAYLNFERYPGPRAIVRRSTYGDSTLRVYSDRFKSKKKTLLIVDGEHGRFVKVPVRDVLEDGRVEKENIMTEEQLKRWLGDDSSVGRPSSAAATKKDPRCRFVFLVNDSVTSPLEVSADFLTRIFTYHQVMPSFLDFLYVYGDRSAEDREVRFSGFRTERLPMNPGDGEVIPALNRSGRRYQMCYNVKAVALKEEDKAEDAVVNKLWKIRQAAVHHQFDVGSGCQFWVFGDPHAALKERISDLCSERENQSERFGTFPQSFRTSLDIHLLNYRWAMEGWLAYIQSLEEIVDNLTSHLLHMGDKDDEKGRAMRLQPGALGRVQQYEDLTNESILVLQSNADIMSSMLEFYKSIVKDSVFGNEASGCGRIVDEFSSQLEELIYDAKTQIARSQILGKIIADRKSMLIQHLQAQAAERAEEFTATMWKAAERSENEAIAMRIITVITLIYLPPTFSSTFFSTDVVKYQGGGGGGGGDSDTGSGSNSSGASATGDADSAESFSQLALWRWLEVSLPLMALTFAVAFGWYLWEWRKRRERSRRLRSMYPDVFARVEV